MKLKIEAYGPNWGLVIVRVAIGLVLLLAGWQKILQGVGPWLVEETAHRIAESPRLYAWWGQRVLLHAPEAFAYALSWGSFLLGCALFLGILVRPVGVIVAFLMLNVFFAGPPHVQPAALLIGVCALACAVSRAGRRMGFDEGLDLRLPFWLTWSRG